MITITLNLPKSHPQLQIVVGNTSTLKEACTHGANNEQTTNTTGLCCNLLQYSQDKKKPLHVP